LLGLNDPETPLQIPVVVGPVTNPETVAEALFWQTVMLVPALTIGALVKLIMMSSTVWLQLPLFVEIRVKLTEPAAISAALGVYSEFNVVLLGVKVPVPPAQIPVEVGPFTEPEREEIGLLLHTDILEPALTIGAPVNVTKILSFTWLQFPLLLEANTKYTDPAATSVGVGVYVEVNAELAGLNNPVPPDQTPVVE